MFLVDNERSKEIAVRFGEKQFTMPKSTPEGHFETVLRVATESVGPGENAFMLRNDWVRFRALTRDDDRRIFAGRVQVLEPEGVSVVSDIDDTIKISNVRDRGQLIRNTFLRPYDGVPGMAALYREVARRGGSFHYVSASPWQLYPSISNFMLADAFPEGSFHMRKLRWKDASLAEFFSPSDEYKVSTIEGLLATFPKRRFLLVGDSIERDPEVYGRIARKHPEQLMGIFIRTLRTKTSEDARFAAAFKDVPADKWTLFEAPADAREKMLSLIK
jgi:phosphatidate phosphatase APP1